MRFSSLLIAAPFALAASSANAHKIEISEDSWLNIDALLQAQYQTAEDAAPTGDAWSNDLFLRRARFILFGNITKDISFFMDTEQANLGKNGDWATPFYLQDAFMSFHVVDELNVDAGMILLPFSRPNMQSAVALNSLDYHSSVIKFPDGSTKGWRDAGLQLRGYVFDSKLVYRAGLFAGSQNVALQKDAAGNAVVDDTGKSVALSNPDDKPRVTGNVRYNFMGTEKDFFAKGLYFTKEPIISVGVGADFAPDAVLTKAAVQDDRADPKKVTEAAEIGHHLGVAGDFFVDYPLLADSELVLQGAFYFYDDGEKVATSGKGFFGEAGFRFGQVEPVLSLDYFMSDADAADYQALTGGLNYFIKNHNANVKTAFVMDKKGDLDKAEWMKSITLQGQFFF